MDNSSSTYASDSGGPEGAPNRAIDCCKDDSNSSSDSDDDVPLSALAKKPPHKDSYNANKHKKKAPAAFTGEKRSSQSSEQRPKSKSKLMSDGLGGKCNSML